MKKKTKLTKLYYYRILCHPQDFAGRSCASRAFNAALSNCTEWPKTYLNYTPYKILLADYFMQLWNTFTFPQERKGKFLYFNIES